MNPFSNQWIYRSYLNVGEAFGDLKDPRNRDDFVASLFAEARLELAVDGLERLTGRLDFGDGVGLDLRGTASYGHPYAIRFQGVGTHSYAAGWIYDYVGFLVPAWPNGVEQVPAIVGSVIRTVDHGAAKAGKVASFIAVRTGRKDQAT